MGIIGKDFLYKKISNFISQDEIRLLGQYCEIKHRLNSRNFDRGQTSLTADTYFYGDPLMDSLMLQKQKLMEKL